jgi:hypothetical protein
MTPIQRLMITPGGIECIVCGPVGTRVLGVVSIGLGILGFVVSRLRALGKAAAGLTLRKSAALRASSQHNVCYWHIADVPLGLTNVRFWGQPLAPNSGHVASLLKESAKCQEETSQSR